MDSTPFAFEREALIAKADELLQRLFPLCRSLTGQGVRQTLAILRQVADFEVHEVPSGTPCYDWSVPDEWQVRDAYIADAGGRRLVDFQVNNLHLVGYSIPFQGWLSFDKLRPHLYTLPSLPEAIPYRTSYYQRNWGFCLTHQQLQEFDPQATYQVVVDTSLQPGAMTYGEVLLPGSSGQEYLISTYVCHPSLANDNLSGVVLWTLLLAEMLKQPHYHSYRFVIAPETIGALAYIANHEQIVRQLAGGLVITTVAGPGAFGYKTTWQGNHLIDRLVRRTFAELKLDYVEYPFDINGSDERQYSTPGLRVPLGTIAKDKYYEYLYYHTSLDNLDFIRAEYLVESLQLYRLVIEKLEQNRCYRSLNPFGEPMLGKRGLYPQLGGSVKQKAVDLVTQHAGRSYLVDDNRLVYGDELDAMRWLLFSSDGHMTLLEIAERTGIPLRQLSELASRLCQHGLLEVCD